MCWDVSGRLLRVESSTSAGGFGAHVSIACLLVIESLRTPLGHGERVFGLRGPTRHIDGAGRPCRGDDRS
jgi:hypothetical protein